MNNVTQQYLNTLRSNTAYPTYRGFIGVIAMLGYLLAGVFGLGALIGGLTTMSRSFLAGVAVLIMGGIVAALNFLLARLFREAALIVADIGDATVDAGANSHTGAARAAY
jgi:hypothetical protein